MQDSDTSDSSSSPSARLVLSLSFESPVRSLMLCALREGCDSETSDASCTDSADVRLLYVCCAAGVHVLLLHRSADWLSTR